MSPFLIPPSTLDQIRDRAVVSPDVEICGLLLRTPNGITQYPCQNRHNQPDKGFEISADEYAIADQMGEVIGVYHSHIANDRHFSVEDIKAADSENQLWVLYHVPTNRLEQYHPQHPPPYLGREFRYAYQNCYTLMRDFYYQEFEIELPRHYLSSGRSFLTEDVGFLANLPINGFDRVVGTPRRGDIILTYNGCPYPNHVIVALCDRNGMHHQAGAMSATVRFDGLPDIHSIWRHRSAKSWSNRSED